MLKFSITGNINNGENMGKKKINAKKHKFIKTLIQSKYFYITLVIIIGLLLTMIFSNIYIDCDIVFAIGSGIFGSAFVTLLIEILNDIRENKNIKRQKKFTFSDIKADIKFILEHEISNFSNYCYIYTNRETIQKKSVTIADILTDLDNYADKINNFIFEDCQLKDKIIDENWLKNANNKDKYLCLDAVPYYERLLQSVNKIIGNKDLYLNFKVINETDYDEIKLFGILLQYVVIYSNSKSRDYTIEMKKQLFEQIPKLFRLLNIKDNEIINIRF